MKKQKGFTLVELLAVIVILAIIALIAVPIVMNVIEDARKGAAKSSALGYIDATEKTAARNLLDTDTTNDIGIGKHNVENLTVKVKGEKPTEGCITIATNGVISDYSLKIGKYVVNKKDNTQEVIKNGSVRECSGEAAANSGGSSSSNKSSIIGKSINYNPTTNQKCDSPVSTTGTKTGCMKFYVVKDSGSTVDVILDHNTTTMTNWNSEGSYRNTTTYNNIQMKEVKTVLEADTQGWNSNLSPRLITAEEVASITGKTDFDSGDADKNSFFFGSNNDTNYSSQTEEQKARQRSFAWLFDYTKNCTSYGCNTADSSTQGYWTSTPTQDMYDGYAWDMNAFQAAYVSNDGGIDSYSVLQPTHTIGVRPVITISSSLLD